MRSLRIPRLKPFSPCFRFCRELSLDGGELTFCFPEPGIKLVVFALKDSISPFQIRIHFGISTKSVWKSGRIYDVLDFDELSGDGSLSCAEPFVFNGESTVRATMSVVYNQQSSKGRAKPAPQLPAEGPPDFGLSVVPVGILYSSYFHPAQPVRISPSSHPFLAQLLSALKSVICLLTATGEGVYVQQTLLAESSRESATLADCV